MVTPRPYISYSQMVLIERSPELYIQQYLYDKKSKDSVNIWYGGRVAKALEHSEATGDPVLDFVLSNVPAFDLRDQSFEADLKNGSEVIKVLAKPDTHKSDYSAFKEYKTSIREFKQKMADESAQITFYATTMWLLTGKIPHDIELVQIKVRYRGNSGVLEPTGEILRFPTKRSMVDVIRMTGRIKRAWKKIQVTCREELL